MAVPFTQQVAATFDAVANEKSKAADQWSDTSALNHLEKIGGVKRVAGGATLQPKSPYGVSVSVATHSAASRWAAASSPARARCSRASGLRAA